MRVFLAVALVILSAGAALASPSGTSLRIAVSTGPNAPARVMTLRCEPAAGTVERPTLACARLLAAGRAVFAPTTPGTACTEIYGGSQTALVTGTLRGVRVWARFRRRDGCEIARWNRVAFLLGPLQTIV